MTRQSGRRISHWFLFFGLVPTIVIGLFLTGYIIMARYSDAEAAFVEHGQAYARELAAASVYGLFVGDDGVLEQAALSYLDRANVIGVAIHDREGAPRAVAGMPLMSNQEDSGVILFEQDVSPLSISIEPSIQSRAPQEHGASTERLGFVRLAFDKSEFTARIGRIAANSVLILIFGLGIAAYFIYRGSRRISGPLEQVSESVRQVGDKNFDVRIPVTASGELRDLQEGVNGMIVALAHQQEELRHQIDAATVELRDTMEELEERNADLDIARKEAVKANHVKSEFLAHMSHEIRTPMNGVLGFLDLLQRTPLDNHQQEQVETIRRSASDLLAIINDILDFSKIEAGKLKLLEEPVCLSRLVYETAHLFTPQASEKRLQLAVIVAEGVPEGLQGDRLRIRQILVNLLSNAIKFTDRGSVILRVATESHNPGHCGLLFSVADTGIGIAPEDCRRLFDAFSQAHSATHYYQGTGLGLAITKSLAEAMGGRVTVSSRLGIGSAFTVRIKLALGAAEMQEPVTGLPASLHVRVVEPDSVARESLISALRAIGSAWTVTDSSAASEGRCDAVIVGLSVPRSSEDEDVAALSNWTGNGKPVVVCAGSVDAGIEQACRERGAAAYLVKPVAPTVLADTLRQILNGTAEPSDSASPALAADEEPVGQGVFADRLFLVADDNQINRRLISLLIDGHKGRVIEAENGAAAVKAAHAHSFDAILLDIYMPVMDGIAAAREIRALPQYATTPIVALTADAVPEHRDQIHGAGIDNVLIKPVAADELVALLTRALSDRPERQPSPVVRDIERAIRNAGSRTVADDLFQRFRAELPSHMSELRRALDAGDPAVLRDQIHMLKGGASVCAVTRFLELLEEFRSTILETAGQEGKKGLANLQIEADRIIASGG